MRKLLFFGFVGLLLVGCGAGNLDQGQVKYTPGVPPWQEKDPAKKGPGGPGSQTGAAPAASTPAPGSAPAGTPNGNTTQAPPGGLPPGMSEPKRGM